MKGRLFDIESGTMLFAARSAAPVPPDRRKPAWQFSALECVRSSWERYNGTHQPSSVSCLEIRVLLLCAVNAKSLFLNTLSVLFLAAAVTGLRAQDQAQQAQPAAPAPGADRMMPDS